MQNSSLSSLRAFIRPALLTGLVLGLFVVVFVALLLFQLQFEVDEQSGDGGGGELIDKRLLEDPFFATARLFQTAPTYPVGMRFFDPDKPVAPSGFVATAAADGRVVVLRWDTSSVPTDAEIIIKRIHEPNGLTKRDPNWDWDKAAVIVTVPAQSGSYRDTDVPVGGALVYAIATKTVTAKISALVNSTAVTARDTIPPPPPRNIVVQSESGGVRIAWINPAVADFASVSLYRSSAGQGTLGTLIATNITNNSYVDKEVVSGEQYWYTLISIDTTGNESPAAPALESAGNINPFAEQADSAPAEKDTL